MKKQLTRIKWLVGEPALPSYSVAEVQAGFEAHPDTDKNLFMKQMRQP
jgi:cytochrome c oxidase subunit 3